MLRETRNSIVETVSKRHIAGSSLRDTLPVVNWVSEKGYGLILSPWAPKEFTVQDMMRECLACLSLLDLVRKDGVRSPNESPAGENRQDGARTRRSVPVLSIKLNALGFDSVAIQDLFQQAIARGVRLHVDSLAPERAPQTFRILEVLSSNRVRNNGESPSIANLLGVTIPTRWRRSRDDIQRAAELGLAVRLVKGQWEDASHPVDPLENAKRLLSFTPPLASSPSRHASLFSVASHDLVYLKQVLKTLQKQAIRHDIEQFFSLPINGENVAQEFNIPLSIYIAYGSPALPYNIRFSVTRPRLAFWMASDYLLPKKRAWEVK